MELLIIFAVFLIFLNILLYNRITKSLIICLAIIICTGLYYLYKQPNQPEFYKVSIQTGEVYNRRLYNK